MAYAQSKNLLCTNSNVSSIVQKWTLVSAMAFAEAIEIDAILLLSQRSRLFRCVPQPKTTVTDLNTALEKNAEIFGATVLFIEEKEVHPTSLARGLDARFSSRKTVVVKFCSDRSRKLKKTSVRQCL